VLDKDTGKDTGAVKIVERSIADGIIIRELGGTLRPAIQHAINQRRLVPGAYYRPGAGGAARARLLDYSLRSRSAAMGNPPRQARQTAPSTLCDVAIYTAAARSST
jgi:hypothetical protein